MSQLVLRRYPTPYVDRAGLLTQVVGGLITGDEHVVAIVGPPGAGKTRLAVEVLREARGAFPAGALAFVDLRAAGEGEATARVARALGLRTASADAVRRALASMGPSLVVLDDAERHLVELRPLVDHLVDALPGLRLVLTTRERPGTRRERIVELPPLTKPTSAADVEHSEAGRIYVARMRRERRDYVLDAAEAERASVILARLGDLPLAVEVIASEAAVFGSASLVARLDEPLTWLASDRGRAPHDGDSLVEALAGSVARLDADLRRALLETTLFAGPFRVGDAEAVLSAGTRAWTALGALRARSWVVELRDDDGGVRFDVLAPVREVLRSLVSVEPPEPWSAARERHTAYFLALATGEGAAREAALADVLAAIDDATARAMPVAPVVAALRLMWEPARADGRATAYAARARALATLAATRGDAESEALSLEAYARAARESGRFDDATHALDDAERVARAAGAVGALDRIACCRAGLAFKMGRYDILTALAPYAPATDHADDAEAFATGAAIRGEREVAVRTYAEAIARADRARDVTRTTILTACAARFHVECGDGAVAERYLSRLPPSASHDAAVHASLVTTHALAADNRGQLDEAIAGYDEALARYARLASPLVAYLAQVRALATLATGRIDEAHAAFRAARSTHMPSMLQLAPLAALGDWVLDDLVPPAPPTTDRIVATTFELVAAFVATRTDATTTARLDAARIAHRELEAWSVVSRVLARFLSSDASSVTGTRAAALLVDPEHRWFAAPGGAVVSLATRPVLQRVLAVLVDARLAAPGSRVNIEEIAACAWPGEQMRPDSRKARVYVAISTLRQLGLDDLLRSATGGYRLEPSADCRRGAAASTRGSN